MPPDNDAGRGTSPEEESGITPEAVEERDVRLKHRHRRQDRLLDGLTHESRLNDLGVEIAVLDVLRALKN